MRRLIPLIMCLFGVTQASAANQCSAVFPDGVSTHSAGGNISFGENSQLIGSDDNRLATSTISKNAGSNKKTCNTADCLATGAPSNPASSVSFQTTASTVDITLGWKGTVVVGSGSTGNEFDDINPWGSGEATITFSNNHSEYFVDRLVMGYKNTLHLQAGSTYWINQLTLNSETDIIVQGAGTALIYVNQNVIFPDKGLTNSPSKKNSGDASKLVMYVFANVTLNSESTYSGSLYTKGNLTLISSSYIFGAASSANIQLNKGSTITYQSAEVADTDFGSICGSSPPSVLEPILDYRFDACSYDGIAGDVIDQTGSFNGGSNGVSASTNNTRINHSLDLSADNTSDWVDVPSSVVNGLNNFSVAVWFKTSVEKEQQKIFHALGNDTDDDELEISLYNSDYVYIKVRNKSQYLKSTIEFTDDRWHHLVLTRVDQNVCLFIDGAAQECGNGVSGGELSVDNNDAVVMGQEQDEFGGGFSVEQNFVGYLDEFKIFDVKLSDNEINSIYQNELAGRNFDDSPRDALQCEYICESIPGELNSVGIRIAHGGSSNQINTVTEALTIHTAWLNAGSPESGLINNGGYNVAESGSNSVDRIDFGGNDNSFTGTLPYPGISTVGNQSFSDFLVHTSGTLSLPAGDYTIYVESDDGFSFIMDTLSGDTVSFNKFVGTAGGFLGGLFGGLFGNTTPASTEGASNELRFEGTTGNARTGGSFTLTQDSVFEIAAIFFERTGGDFLEISIANGIPSANSNLIYEIMREGALNNKVKFGQCIPSLEIQAGRAILKNTANSPEFTSVCFDTPFSEVPRVFSLPTTDDDDDRLALRIRNVTTTGFDIAQVEPSRITSLDSPAGNVSQTVDFLAIPEGDYHLDGSAMMRVGSVSTKAFQGNQAGGSQSWVTISTADLAFSQTPAIIASIQTMNNETNPFPISIPFLATTVSSVGNTNFNIALERGETNGDYLDNNETIGFLAITPGSGELTNDISYESFLTDNSITGEYSCQVSNLNTYNSNPLVIASQNTRNGSNGGWLKRCSITPSSVGFTIVEDQAFDAEGGHISERAGGVALGGTFTNMTCNTQDVHHYRIEHDEQGFTCEAETVTIKACADANCESLYDQDTTITLSDLGLAGDGWSNGNEITIPASTAMSITLSVTEDTEDGSVSFSKTSANPNASLRCFSGSTETCEMSFSNDGFEFFGATTAVKTLTDQKAETDFSDVNIRAVRNDAGVCKPLLDGPQDISFTYNCEDPATCLTPLAGIELNSAPGDDQSGTLRVTFASNGTAPMSMLNYADVGRLNLTVSAQIKNVTVTSGKATVDVYPDELRVNVQPPSDVSNTASTYVAGAIFDLTIGAYGMQGKKLPNYQPGDLQMLLQRITPDAASTIEGILTLDNTPHTTALAPGYQSTTIPIFDDGKYSFTANYDEVGKIQINFKDGDYLGNSIDSAGPLNLGRFIPAYFKITQNTPSLRNTRSGSSYIGEYIPFSESLVYQITAKNASGQTTSNYGGDLWKLSFNASHVSFTDNTMNSGEILGDISSNGTESDYDGKATYSITQPASTEFAIYTSPLARIPKTHIPINPIDMSFTPVITTVAANAASSVIRTIADSDGVCFKPNYSSACQVFDSEVIQGAQARYGRLVIESTYGPEQEDLSVPIKAEYFINNQWLINQDDNSTSVAFDLSAGQLLLSGEASLKNSVGNVSSNGRLLGGKSVGHQLKFSAPHVSGELLLELVPDATGTIWSNYLNYDWNNNLSINQDDKPSATVTFGQFRGNDKIIHWREVFN